MIVLEIEHPHAENEHFFACRFRSQNLWSSSRTNYNWTSSSSSHNTISWHHWNWNSDSMSSWVVVCRGKRRWVTSQRPRPQSALNCYWKDLLQKKANLVPQRWRKCSIEETHAKLFEIHTNLVFTYSKEAIPIKESGMTFLRINNQEEILLKPKSQNWSWDWYVVIIKTKWKQTALFTGIRCVRKAFQKAGGQKFSDS